MDLGPGLTVRLGSPVIRTCSPIETVQSLPVRYKFFTHGSGEPRGTPSAKESEKGGSEDPCLDWSVPGPYCTGSERQPMGRPRRLGGPNFPLTVK